MTEQLEKSERDAERISAILSEGKDLPSEMEQSSVTNLMRSSLNSMMSLVQKKNTLSKREMFKHRKRARHRV